MLCFGNSRLIRDRKATIRDLETAELEKRSVWPRNRQRTFILRRLLYLPKYTELHLVSAVPCIRSRLQYDLFTRITYEVRPMTLETRMFNHLIVCYQPTMASNEPSSLYEKGKEVRIKVLSEAYVTEKLKSRQSEFPQPLQQFSTEVAWGSVWARPGLALRDRSLASMRNLVNKHIYLSDGKM